MEISPVKKPKFDAFFGNPLVKPESHHRMGASRSLSMAKGAGSTLRVLDQQYNFDLLWKGSVSNLMSSEHITEDLIKESIKELELAMKESKRMLVERDNEILKLREFIDNNKLNESRDNKEDSENNKNVLEQLDSSQKRNIQLERQLHDLQLNHSKEIAHFKEQHKSPPIWHIEDIGNNPECTCYCGSVCKALHDLIDAKQSLNNTKTKYESLKKRVREFRKQAEIDQRNKEAFGGMNNGRDGDRTSCSIQ